MCSTPEVDKIYSKRIRVDAMTEKGEAIVMNLVARVIINMLNEKINHA